MGKGLGRRGCLGRPDDTLLFLVLAVGSIRTSPGAFGLSQAGNDPTRLQHESNPGPEQSPKSCFHTHISIRLPILSLTTIVYTFGVTIDSEKSGRRKEKKKKKSESACIILLFIIQPTLIFINSPLLQNSSPRIQPTATYPTPLHRQKQNSHMRLHKNRPTKRRTGLDNTQFFPPSMCLYSAALPASSRDSGTTCMYP